MQGAKATKSAAKMKLLPEELDILFQSEKLLFTHSQEIVLAVPVSHGFSLSQTAMLKTILARLNFSNAAIPWHYYENFESIPFEDIFSRFSPKILLVIRPMQDQNLEPEHKKVSGVDVFYLPHPEKFEFNDAVKRPIWNLLKPFSAD